MLSTDVPMLNAGAQAVSFRLALAGVPAADVMSAAGARAVQLAVAAVVTGVGALPGGPPPHELGVQHCAAHAARASGPFRR